MLVRASAIKANSHSRHLVLNDEQALQHPQLPQQRCRTNQESAILPSTKTRQEPHDPTKGELQKQRHSSILLPRKNHHESSWIWVLLATTLQLPHPDSHGHGSCMARQRIMRPATGGSPTGAGAGRMSLSRPTTCCMVGLFSGAAAVQRNPTCRHSAISFSA